MIKKICPICDQEMKTAHYCKYCRSWVRQPIEQKVSYYLNEKRSDVRRRESLAQRQERPSASGQPVLNRPSQSSMNRQSRPVHVPPAKKKRRGTWVFWLFVIIFIGIITVTAINDMSRPNKTPEPQEIVELEDDYEDDDVEETDVWDVDEDRVRLFGRACSAYKHYQLTFDELEQEVLYQLSDLGYDYDEPEVYSYNQESSDGTTWYSTSAIYYLEDDDYYFVIDYDTGTNAIHQIYGSFPDLDEATEVTLRVLQVLEEYGEIAPLADESVITRAEIDEWIEEYGYYWTEQDGLYISLDEFDECCDFSIYPSYDED